MLKIFLLQYVLFYFCLSLPAFIFPNFWIIFMFIIVYLYNHQKNKKGKLSVQHVQFKLFITCLILIILSICLIISKGYLSSSIWQLLYIALFPFFPLALISMFMGDILAVLWMIIALLIFDTLVTYYFVRPLSLKKIIRPITIICLCLSIFNIYFYVNSDSIKYKGGHHFTYMNGFSSTDLTDYTPYAQNSKLVTLNEPSTFIIEDKSEMPRLDGAEACYPVYSAIAKAVYKDIDKIENESKDKHSYRNGEIVTFTNTSFGYSRLFNDEIDMFFGAKPSASQLEEAKEMGVQLEYTPIGKEAFVFFVNEKNPISNLTTQQIKDIYHGDIVNWKELGGKRHDIIAFQRPENSGSQAMMNYFMGDVSLKEPLTYEMVDAMSGIIEEVAEYKNEEGAIGYTFKYFLEGLNQEDHIKILSIDGIYPTNESIKNQSYPLSTYLYCVTLKSNKKENVKKLKEYLLSPQGQYIIEQTGYCALN